MRSIVSALILLFCMSASHAAPANTLNDLWAALDNCAKNSDVENAATGSEITVLFSLRRDGSLLGKPRITHSHLVGNNSDQRAFVSAVLSAIAGCLPMPITDGLGGAIAGRPVTFRITVGH